MPISQPSIPITPITQQQQQDKRKPTITDEISTNGGIASIVNTFNQTFGTGIGGENGNRSSRSSSVSSTQPIVSNLIKIYSEATASKSQRNDSVRSTGKHDELIKIFEQATNQNQQRQTSLSSNIKQQSQAREEACEEITWDNLVHG